ncbi:AAA family ATPase [Pseudomonas sp. NPDC089554]|uniref:AAA family ATPase n=1 Tax=Pseudomonas sp. NPDC089554 TaxID=3390653 RepID=UPI003D023E95
MKATDLLRHGANTGEVRIELSGMSEPIVMSLVRRSNRITITPPEPKVMVLAYGATRLMGKLDAPLDSIAQRSKIENLFDPTRLLDNGMPWLNDLKPDDFNRFARALASLLPRSDGVTLARRNRQIIVQSPSGNESLAVVSSGYQAVLALALDIMSVMRHGWQDMATAEGIVLIDEVDAHLHPRWRMRIVQRLREVFPRIQFIATSHEPLTLRGLDSNEIAVLTRRLDGQITALTSDNTQLPSPRHMRVDQLLASDYFGMHSTDDMDSELLFEQYYQLLAIKERTAEQESELNRLRDELQADRRMGLTPRERLVFEAADQFIAQRMATSQALAPQVSQGAINELQALWSELSSVSNDGQEDQA